MASKVEMQFVLSCIILFLQGFYVINGSLIGKFVHEKPLNDGSVLNIINKPASVMFAKDSKPLLADEITSILSLALGFSVPQEMEWKGLLSGNPFDTPNAVVMFTVDSVANGENIKIAAAESFSVKMKEQDGSRTELLSLGSKTTLASHISEIYDGKAYTLSLSADEDLAASGYSDGEKSQTVVWSKKDNAWVMLDSKSPKGEILFTKDQLRSEMASIFNSNGIKYNSKKEQIVVKMKTAEIHFDLKSEADFLFFSELAVAKLMLSKAAASKSNIPNDGIPEVYMIGISTLKDLERSYGANSPQVKAAMSIIEQFIPEVTEMLVKLYNGKILAAQLTLKASTEAVASDSGETKGVYDQVKTHLGKNGIDDYYIRFQELHVTNDIESRARQSLCKQMAGLVAGFGVNMKFKCATEEQNHHLVRRSLLATKNATDTNSLNLASLYDKNFPVVFNLWFWLMVVLILSVYAISLVMWYMDPGQDSIIYRMTSQRIKSD